MKAIGSMERPHDPAAGRVPAKAGEPIGFGAFGGILHPGTADLGVLMLSPLGYEELCVRATWRRLAERLSGAGIPALRFDWPGTADALDLETPASGIDDWKAAILAAAAGLRAAAGVERIVVVGQGLGATLGAIAAPDLGTVEGMVLLAPVAKGRPWLRELSIWAKMLDDTIGLPTDPAETARCAVAGLGLDPGRIEAIRALDLGRLEQTPARRLLLLTRNGRPDDLELAARLGRLGGSIETRPYEGYERLITDPTGAVPPEATIERVADWIRDLARRAATVPADVPAALAPVLVGERFSETARRFGTDDRLYGVECRPAETKAPRAAVFLDAGHDYHIGWARSTVGFARSLAAAGIASLRFDNASIGDSPAAPGDPAEVLYRPPLLRDAGEAVGSAAEAGAERIMLVGRCSGGYAALHTAFADPRVTDLVLINVQRFMWHPAETIEDAIRYGHQTIASYGARVLSRAVLGRIWRGEVDVPRILRHIATRIGAGLGARLAPWLGPLTTQGRLARRLHRNLAALRDRGVRVTIVYAEGDIGLPNFEAYFGRGGRRLSAYPNMDLIMVPDADHNLTRPGAQRVVADILVRVATR